MTLAAATRVALHAEAQPDRRFYAARLGRFRAGRGWSYADLAAWLGCSEDQLSHVYLCLLEAAPAKVAGLFGCDPGRLAEAVG